MMDGSARSSESNSPASGDLSDRTEKKDSSSPQNLNDYADVGLMRGNSPSYTPESLQQHDTTELPSFSVSEYITSFEPIDLFIREAVTCFYFLLPSGL